MPDLLAAMGDAVAHAEASTERPQASTSEAPSPSAKLRQPAEEAPLPPEISREGQPRLEGRSLLVQKAACEGEAAAVDAEGDLEAEWNEIEERTDALRQREQENIGKVVGDAASKAMSYSELNQWLSQVKVDTAVLRPLLDDRVEDTTTCGCLPGRKRSRGDVPHLDKKHWKEKDFLLFLKMTHFDFNDSNHFWMLRTVHTKLARAKICPTIGNHWEVIGFQNTDPRMDLNRSGCVLNVIHLFWFFSHYFELLKSMYLLAQDDQQNFPLACISINITRMVLDCFLSGKLSRLCNARAGERPVLETTCSMHAAGFAYFGSRWRSMKRTIRDTEQALNEIRALMEPSPSKLLSELAKIEEAQKLKSHAAKLEFTDLEFGGPKATGRVASASKVPTMPDRMRNYKEEGHE